MNNNKILMIGTALETMGGISTVVNAYRKAGLFEINGIKYLTTHKDGSKTKKLYTAFSAYFNFGFLLFFCNYDILHIHVSSRASFWRKSPFIVLGSLFRRKIIFHLHGSEFKIFFDVELSGLRKKMARKIINMPDVIITLSNSWELWAKQTVSKPKVICIHNSICPIPNVKGSKRRQKQLLFLGRIGERKGLFDLISALANDKLKGLDFKLLIGGDGDLEAAKLLIEKYNLESQIVFLGWVTGKEKIRLLQTSTVFLLPSYNEGMPMSVLEALASGLPIISTTVGGIPQQVTNGEEGFLIEPGDVETLAQRIYELGTDQRLWQSMSTACIQKFDKCFSTPKALPELKKVYQELRN
jgi:glycosyltransferase involved in cell wall biosynthesis